MTVNFEELEKVVLATELLPLGGFDMEHVSCGTAGCMIGNYNALTGREQRPDWEFYAKHDFEHFGITKLEYKWLFAAGAYSPDSFLDSIFGRKKVKLYTDWDLREVERDEALARLCKFIAYKRRKNDLIHDEKYGVSVRSRSAEGNHNFVMLAKNEVVAV